MSTLTQQFQLIDFDKVGLFINGKWIHEGSKGTFDVVNPSTKQVIAKVPKGGSTEAKQAINAAEVAFPIWTKLTAQERGYYLLKIRDLMLEHKEEIGTIISLEMGKAYTEAVGEVTYAASFLTWYAEEGKRVYGETIPASDASKRLMVIKQAAGVVAAITPWNFPIAMMTRKIGPALAAGCTSIVKPASQSPLTALAFARIVELAEVPAGVINIIVGATGEISNEIFESDVVRKVSFTGSTEIGKDLVKASAKTLKKLSLELGGHAPFLVLEDADIEQAATGAILSKFRNAGQTCVCANRIFVHKNVAEQFKEAFVKKAEKLIVGESIDATVQVGPLVNAEGLLKVEEQVQDAVNKGAKIETGGEKIDSLEGFFYKPTILSGVTSDMIIMSEETFGPVAPIVEFESIDEVIQEANSTQYGLAAYVYTRDLATAITVSERLEFGIIGLNDAAPGVSQAPFGGIKHSGYGREGGHQGISDYLEEKYISIQI
ncbi:NAD-dependent succinate-semialdehyde dehydrogenase [Psychrobacillus soli]|uniref:NAD-dependent succinate-semialdehyde dehydrogenase n=1 Tax=Psychrobacillus soli TaxID=1543965 RepID=A0A544TLE4_9BACI|nr:NAD-dependent succinate-semialdehyde dehydrogenase [Psychrobacillus soli]TQR18238.1 NAD-dependent succinate-semialdehyde dehydrogenase [Psychrobacillus soli]